MSKDSESYKNHINYKAAKKYLKNAQYDSLESINTFPYLDKLNVYVRAALKSAVEWNDGAIMKIYGFSSEQINIDFVWKYWENSRLIGIAKDGFDEWFVDAAVAPKFVKPPYAFTEQETDCRPLTVTWSYWYIPIDTKNAKLNALIAGYVISFLSLFTDNFRNAGYADKNFATALKEQADFNNHPDLTSLQLRDNRDPVWRNVDYPENDPNDSEWLKQSFEFDHTQAWMRELELITDSFYHKLDRQYIDLYQRIYDISFE